jgi:CRP/FNR family cyclic AMP-dependent transcriptional regulator
MNRTAPLTDFDSIVCILSQLRIFGGVTDAQRMTIFRRLELWPLKQGECVFCKEDEPSAIYVVKSGKIDIQIAENDVLIHKHALCVGESFGEASFMSMHRHTATAVAAVESEVIVLSRNALIHLKHEDIELFALLMMNLARELARRLYLTDQMLLAARGKSASPA